MGFLGAEPQEREPHLLGEVRGHDAVEIRAHVGDDAVDRLLDPAGFFFSFPALLSGAGEG